MLLERSFPEGRIPPESETHYLSILGWSPVQSDQYGLRIFQLELQPLESLYHDYRPGSAYSPALTLVKLRAARAGTEILVTVSETFRSPSSWNATSPFILVYRTY